MICAIPINQIAGDKELQARLLKAFDDAINCDAFDSMDAVDLLMRAVDGRLLCMYCQVEELTPFSEASRIAGEGIATLEIVSNAQGRKAAHIMTVTGTRFALWMPELAATVRRLALAQGAQLVTFTGREGWARSLRKQGFRTAQITMALDLAEPVTEQEQQGIAANG